MHTSYSICTYSLHFSWYSFFFYFHIVPLESAVVFLISFVLDFHISFFAKWVVLLYFEWDERVCLPLKDEMISRIKSIRWWFQKKILSVFFSIHFFHPFLFLSSAVFLSSIVFPTLNCFFSSTTNINALLIFFMHNI